MIESALLRSIRNNGRYQHRIGQLTVELVEGITHGAEVAVRPTEVTRASRSSSFTYSPSVPTARQRLRSACLNGGKGSRERWTFLNHSHSSCPMIFLW